MSRSPQSFIQGNVTRAFKATRATDIGVVLNAQLTPLRVR